MAGRIRELRKAAGLTQEQLAAAAGTTTKAIFYYERGKRVPHLAKAIRLADALDCSLDHLVGRTWPAKKRGRP